MATLTYLATVLAHLKADDYAQIRHMRIKMPPDKRPKEKREPKQRVDPGVVAALVLYDLNAVQRAA